MTMKKENNIYNLMKNLRPRLVEEDFVFTMVDSLHNIALEELQGMIREEEGITLVVKKDFADKHRLNYDFPMAMISLDVYSSLEAVGLTAVVSKELANYHISCNIMAGYYHDHLFVIKDDAEKALKILNSLST